jgi:hypothetical protein
MHLGNIGDPNCDIKCFVKDRKSSLLKDEVTTEFITALIPISTIEKNNNNNSTGLSSNK